MRRVCDANRRSSERSGVVVVVVGAAVVVVTVVVAVVVVGEEEEVVVGHCSVEIHPPLCSMGAEGGHTQPITHIKMHITGSPPSHVGGQADPQLVHTFPLEHSRRTQQTERLQYVSWKQFL